MKRSRFANAEVGFRGPGTAAVAESGAPQVLLEER
jgi:hypothetical protein